jgi:shikimate dehydrogenase
LLSAGTRLVALLGHPVEHSLSPRMQNAAFAARGLDWAYVACDVAPAELEAAIHGLAALGFAGATVTAPHKLEAARIVGAASSSVNTLVIGAGGIAGHSTDAAILADVRADRSVVIGDGGAARAFMEALPQARRFSRHGDWPPDASGADLVVNATPVLDEVLVEVGEGQTLIDLPYPNSATARRARVSGARVHDGLDVLVAQGSAAFELWTGVPAPIEVMRAAVAPSRR